MAVKGAARGHAFFFAAALFAFLFIVAAMTASLPARLQNSLADVSARIYIDVPHVDPDTAARGSTDNTRPSTPAPPRSGTEIHQVSSTTTTTTIEERGPVPTEPPTSSAAVTSPAAQPTLRPPATADSAIPGDRPSTIPTTSTTSTPSTPVPTTLADCVGGTIERADAQIEKNPTVVQVFVKTGGVVQHLQAGIAGLSFTPLTKVSNAFLGSVISVTPISPGTDIVLVACQGTVTATVKAHT